LARRWLAFSLATWGSRFDENYKKSGILSTASGLVFGGGMDGNFVALDARTRKVLWHVHLGGPNASGPISYAVDGAIPKN
jgi:glucose dehydrogenase